MIVGGRLLGDDDAVAIGLESLDWYTELCDGGSFLRFPGHRGLAPGDDVARSGDEQPLEALAFLEAHRAAADATGGARHLAYVRRALQWFSGANRLGLQVGDERSGAGADGIGTTTVSRNCGAESTLAYVAARLHGSALDLGVGPASASPSSAARPLAGRASFQPPHPEESLAEWLNRSFSSPLNTR
jgi:hypothetical protein